MRAVSLPIPSGEEQRRRKTGRKQRYESEYTGKWLLQKRENGEEEEEASGFVVPDTKTGAVAAAATTTTAVKPAELRGGSEIAAVWAIGGIGAGSFLL